MLVASISDFQLLLVHLCGQFFWKWNKKQNKNFSRKLSFSLSPFFSSLHKALEWYTCGGASHQNLIVCLREKRKGSMTSLCSELSWVIPFSCRWKVKLFELLLWTAQIEQRRSSWPVELLREDALEGFEKEMRGVKRMFISCTSPSLHGSVFTVAQYNVWKSILISKATDSSRLFMVFLLSFESVIWCWCFFFYSLRTLQKQWYA